MTTTDSTCALAPATTWAMWEASLNAGISAQVLIGSGSTADSFLAGAGQDELESALPQLIDHPEARPPA